MGYAGDGLLHQAPGEAGWHYLRLLPEDDILTMPLHLAPRRDLFRIPSYLFGWGSCADCGISNTAKMIRNGCGLVT